MSTNIVIALSSLIFVNPAKVALDAQDDITYNLIVFVMVASFLSHLLENHKMGSRGIRFDMTKKDARSMSIKFNWIDRIAAYATFARFVYLYFTSCTDLRHSGCVKVSNDDWTMLGITFLIGFLSEIRVGNMWAHHVPLHCMWHFMMARNMTNFLQKLY